MQTEIRNTIEASTDSIQELAQNLSEIEQIEIKQFKQSYDMMQDQNNKLKQALEI